MARVFDAVEEFWGDKELQLAWSNADAGGQDLIDAFEHRFAQFVSPSSTGLFVSGGRVALRLALDRSKRPGREYVIAPVYCCKVVGQSIVSAGLRPYLVDSGPMPGTIDWNECEKAILTQRVAALIVPYLFGLPLDIRPILETARRHRVIVIEDCASCFGGRIGDDAAGSVGDFSVFSFNFGKPMFLGGGGFLIQNNNSNAPRGNSATNRQCYKRDAKPETERRELESYLSRLRSRRSEPFNPPKSKFKGTRSIVRKVLGPGYWYLRWMGKKLLRRQDPADEFNPPPSVGLLRAALGLILLDQYSTILRVRNENFELLRQYVPHDAAVEFVLPDVSVVPAWLNARIVFPMLDVSEVDKIALGLCCKGYNAGRVYGYTMDQFVPIRWRAWGGRNFPNSRRHSHTSIELPIHQNLDSTDLRLMASVITHHLKSIHH
jgi:dTDP-4-amino-4,6-dideoxygalactose transaminase